MINNNRRELVLRDVEIKFIVSSVPEGRPSNAGHPFDKSYIHLVIDGHTQEPEVARLIDDLLLLPVDDADKGGGPFSFVYWSTPIRQALQFEGKPEVDTRRMLRTTVSKNRCPVFNPNVGRVTNAITTLWSGQTVDVQLDFYRVNIIRPHVKREESRVKMVYANALGFKLTGGIPKGLQNLIDAEEINNVGTY